MLRTILAILLGLFLGGAFNMGIVQLSHVVYPFPAEVDANDIEQLAAHVKANGLPVGALLMVIAAHSGGSLVSGLVVGLITKRVWYAAAICLGVWWMIGGITMLFILPSPIWFAIVDLALYVPAAMLGVRFGGGLLEPAPLPAEAT